MPSGRKRRDFCSSGNADLLTKIVLPSLDKLSAQNNYLPVGLLVLAFLSSEKKNPDEGKGVTSRNSMDRIRLISLLRPEMRLQMDGR